MVNCHNKVTDIPDLIDIFGLEHMIISVCVSI